MKAKSIVLLSLGLALYAGVACRPALAEGPTADATPSSADIVKQLTPEPKSRSLRGIVIERQQQAGPPRQSVDLTVGFELASAKFTAESRQVLDKLGTALNDASLLGSHFRIVGHTDASGNPGTNLALSKKRAEAVAHYLETRHGVAADRLTVEGVGSSQLKDPAHPRAGVNRRVEVINLDS